MGFQQNLSARFCCGWTSAGAPRPTFRTIFRPTRPQASASSARARRAEAYASARMTELLEARTDHTRGPRMPRKSLLASALVLAALIPAPARPADAALPEGLTRITSVEGVTEYRLANGLKILLIPDRSIDTVTVNVRSEEHTSELQSRLHLVCRLLLEKKKKKKKSNTNLNNKS